MAFGGAALAIPVLPAPLVSAPWLLGEALCSEACRIPVRPWPPPWRFVNQAPQSSVRRLRWEQTEWPRVCSGHLPREPATLWDLVFMAFGVPSYCLAQLLTLGLSEHVLQRRVLIIVRPEGAHSVQACCCWSPLAWKREPAGAATWRLCRTAECLVSFLNQVTFAGF